ncbi:MAG: Gfo/Idh/MocA family oxidoreductase [Treponemataceae bacterium]|nr:Gfo/Idh/MocA family oxidoreductase [Treponemataceae bacterium]
MLELIMFKVAIIGAGSIAKKMATTINKMKGFEAYAIASRKLEKAQAFANQFKFTKAYGSYEEMLQDEAVDLVYIATPHSCHKEQALLCLKYKKPVLCEKIFTPSSKDSAQVFEQFEKEKVFINEALWTSFMPSRKILNELLYEKKVIGDITSMDASFKVPLTHKERVVRKDLGGGVLMDIGIYPVTFVFRTLGFDYQDFKIDEIKYKNEVDVKEELTFTYKNGVQAHCHVDGTSIISLFVTIYGSKGKIVMDMVNCPNYIKVYGKRGLLKKFIFCRPKFGGFEFELEESRKAIQEGKLECSQWTHENTLAMAKVVDKVLGE